MVVIRVSSLLVVLQLFAISARTSPLGGAVPAAKPNIPSNQAPPNINPASGEPVPSPDAPAPSPSASGDVAVATPVQRIFLDTDTCSDQDQATINQAWTDAGLLAKAAAGGSLNYDYTIPGKQWLGKWYNFPGWFPIWNDYRDIIGNNLNRANTLHTDNVHSGVWIYLSCPKVHDACSPGTIAGSKDQSRGFWKNHYTIFCPLFFQQDSMNASATKVNDNPQEQEIMENYSNNQGWAFLHETYHYGNSVTQPRALDYCYNAQDCWDMSNDDHKSTGWAYRNADSYALHATAIYMQQLFKTPRPAVPRKYTISLTQASDTTDPGKPSWNDELGNPISAAPLPTAVYKALGDGDANDLFSTTNDISNPNSVPGAQWKIMVGPPLNVLNVPN